MTYRCTLGFLFLSFFLNCAAIQPNKKSKNFEEGKTPALSRRNVKVFRFIASSSLHADNSIYYNKRKKKKKPPSSGFHSVIIAAI